MEGWRDIVELIIIVVCVLLLAKYVVPKLKVGIS